MARYLNVDQVVPEEQIIEISGRRFDVSKVSARKTTELIRVGSWSMSNEIKDDPSKRYEAYVAEMTALIEVLGEDQNGDPAEFDWIIDNVSNAQFQAIVSFITECIGGEQEEVAEGETPANFTGTKKSRRTKK